MARISNAKIAELYKTLKIEEYCWNNTIHNTIQRMYPLIKGCKRSFYDFFMGHHHSLKGMMKLRATDGIGDRTLGDLERLIRKELGLDEGESEAEAEEYLKKQENLNHASMLPRLFSASSAWGVLKQR